MAAEPRRPGLPAILDHADPVPGRRPGPRGHADRAAADHPRRRRLADRRGPLVRADPPPARPPGLPPLPGGLRPRARGPGRGGRRPRRPGDRPRRPGRRRPDRGHPMMTEDHPPPARPRGEPRPDSGQATAATTPPAARRRTSSPIGIVLAERWSRLVEEAPRSSPSAAAALPAAGPLGDSRYLPSPPALPIRPQGRPAVANPMCDHGVTPDGRHGIIDGGRDWMQIGSSAIVRGPGFASENDTESGRRAG